MKRIVGGLVCVIALIGLGVLIHAGTPPTPRWSAPVAKLDQGLAVKLVGDSLLTMPFGYNGPSGPLTARAVGTGRIALQAWRDGARTLAFRFSPDGRSAAGVVRSGSAVALRCVELASGTQREQPLGPGDWDDEPVFHGDGRLVVAQRPVDADATPRFRAFDTESMRLVATSEHSRWGPTAFAGEWMLFTRKDRTGITAWAPATGRTATLPTPFERFFLSATGRRVLVPTVAGCDLWDLEGPPRQLLSLTGQMVGHHIGPDDRMAIVVFGDKPGDRLLRFWSPSGRQEPWECPLTGAVMPVLEASPDGRWFAALGASGLHVLDLRERRHAWTAPGKCHAAFAPDSSAVLTFWAGRSGVEVLEAATGERRAVIPMPKEHHDRPRFLAGGRQLWLSSTGRDRVTLDGWLTPLVTLLRPSVAADRAGVLLGLQWPSRRELLRLADRGVRDYHVADDGSFVITVQEEDGQQVVCRWDLPPARPWALIIGVPLALGAVLLGLSCWKASGTRQGAEEAPP